MGANFKIYPWILDTPPYGQCTKPPRAKYKTPDGLLNGILFDIKGIEGINNRIIKDRISEASQGNRHSCQVKG
jgi:hypothetical protein